MQPTAWHAYNPKTLLAVNQYRAFACGGNPGIEDQTRHGPRLRGGSAGGLDNGLAAAVRRFAEKCDAKQTV